MYKYLLLVIVLVLCAPIGVLSQSVTTGSLSGTVSDAKGLPLAGARVEAIHTPSGTKTGAVTREKGRYNIRGLKVGGPYRLRVTYVGYSPEEKIGIYVNLSQDVVANFTLKEKAATTDEVVVTASSNSAFNPSRNGPASVVTSAEIALAPTINRSIGDFARFNPLVNQRNPSGQDGLAGLSIAGANTRYNNIQIDGAVANDQFGLGEAGTASSQANANPITLDAIQEIQVAASPYDVRQSGFTGGLVNAITKSGTNSYHGTAFFYGRNQDAVGKSPDTLRTKLPDFSDLQFGGSIGGPIIEDKLFFFVAGELRRRSTPIEIGLNDPTSANNFPVAADSLRKIAEIAQTKYGYNVGDIGSLDQRSNSTNIFAKIDWNPDDNNRISLRHNYTNAVQDRDIIRNTQRFTYGNHQHIFTSINNSTVLQWNAVLGSDFYNEARIAYTATRDKREFVGGAFPFITIYMNPSTPEQVNFGVERSSQANSLDQDVLAFTDEVTLPIGDHTFVIGTHNEMTSYDNLFIQDLFGSYTYTSIANFEAGLPSFYRVGYTNADGPAKGTVPHAKWSMFQTSLYAKDEWTFSKDLRFDIGVRADIPFFLDTPFANAKVTGKFPGFQTDNMPSGNMLFSPRLGFNYDLSDGDRTTQLRGGTGLFAGRAVGVWLSNLYGNTGVDLLRSQLGSDGAGRPVIANFKTPAFDPNKPPTPYDTTVYPGKPITTSAINLIADDFKLPQVWRSSIGLDHQFAIGLIGSIEGIYSKQLNEVDYQNLNLRRTAAFGGVSPTDGRPIYRGISANDTIVTAPEFTDVILLKNRSEGYSYNIIASLKLVPQNEFVKNLSAELSYTYGASYELNQAQSSVARSQWASTRVIDPNNVTLERSNFDIPHRISLAVNYIFEYADNWATSIGLFYTGNSGRPYSFTYNGDINNDGANNNDLIYIPNQSDLNTKVVMLPGTNDLRTTDQIWAEYMAFIDANETLAEYRGKILPRNVLREPWVQSLDARITQTIPTFVGQKVELTFDFQNILNMLNSEWGLVKYVDFQSMQLVGVSGVGAAAFDSQGRMRQTFTTPSQIYIKDNIFSRWRMQLGMRYSF